MHTNVFALVLAASLALAATISPFQAQPPAARGQRLEDVTWRDAEQLLTSDAVVVVPLGAGSKEHGPHLKLGNDLKLADYLTKRVLDSTQVIVAPTITYHHYPAFLEYPGSTSLTIDSARGLVVDIVRTLAGYGPRRFYVLNTGVSTIRALDPAADTLASDGILLRYTDLAGRLERASSGVRQQTGGTHADEIETSMMRYVDPSSVDMSKAVRDYTPSSGAAKLTRTRDAGGTYSPSGVWGDPTLATREKGRIFVEALVAGIEEDIRNVRTAALPTRSTARPSSPVARQTEALRDGAARSESEDRCSAGQLRAITTVASAFAANWALHNAEGIGSLWSPGGNIIHSDASVERGPQMITQNRIALFAREEYRQSRHPLLFTQIRCLTEDIAIADGKWDLLNLRTQSGQAAPPAGGLVTMVVKRYGDAWKIEAYRYTVAPPK